MNVTIGTNARRRFHLLSYIFIFEEGVYGICAISALCAPSSFYTAKIQNN